MKIAHTADVHIRGLQYLDEMKFTLDKFCDSIEKEKVDLTVISGDLYHSKLTVTNEYFDLCFKFLKRLTETAPLLIILGNHDLALNNKNRMDALTPVINALGDTKFPVYFLKTADQTVKIENIHFHCLSVLDEKKDWPNQDTIIAGLESGKYDPEDVHIALYHGSINGSKYDNDWISRGNQDDLSTLAGFDYGLLGDIHKYQMLTPRIGYPGSLRQNNFGEDLEKGYLLWDIKSKEEYKVKRIILPQLRYFYSISHDPKEKVPNDLDIKKDCRIFVKLTKRANISEDLKIREAFKRFYKPCTNVVTAPPKEDLVLSDIEIDGKLVSQDNLRLADVQKKLLESFFKNENLDEEILDSLYELDKKYNSHIDTNVARNVIWYPQKMKWENIFSYGKGNSINFNKINGLIGIFGKNMVGKSSIIDTMCYGLFNKINKEGANKNIDYINSRKKKCKVDLEIDFGGLNHFITRTTERPPGKKSTAINTIDFKAKKPLNGETKNDTNIKIRGKFGTLEDLNTTSLCSQENLFSFLNKRGTDKKKFFSKFLDLDIFYEKYAIADKDFARLKTKLKDYDNIEFEDKISQLKKQIEEIKNSLSNSFLLKEEYDDKLQIVNDRIIDHSSKVKDVAISHNEDELDRLLEKNSLEIENLESKIVSLKREEIVLDGLLPKLDDHVEELKVIEEKISLIKEVESQLTQKKKKAKLLEQVPCGDEYPMCPFITEAHRAKASLRNFDVSRLEVKDELQKEREKLSDVISNTKSIKKKVGELGMLRMKLENLQLKTDNLARQKKEIESQRDIIALNQQIHDKILELKNQKDKILMDLGVVNKEILDFTKQEGVLTSDLRKLEDDRDKIKDLRKQYHIYQLYLEAMGKNGISYKIISQRLPLVNAEVNQILSQVTDFTVLIEDNVEAKSISLYIESKEKGKRIVELGSGFEKTMVSLALRAALWNISSLPKTPMLILDEPFGFIEEGKLSATLRMLKYLKNYFTHIFIISHDNNLKSMVDSSIYVSLKSDGFAHCSVN